jgi:hypothetical protein
MMPLPIRIEVVRAAIMPSRLNTSGPATSPARTASYPHRSASSASPT